MDGLSIVVMSSHSSEKRCKLVKRGDVARLAAASHRRQTARTARCRTSRKEQRVKADETAYTFTIGEVTMLLYAFVPYADVARGVVRKFWDVLEVVEATQTFGELLEAEHRSGKPMQEILNVLCLRPHEPDTAARIRALLHEHRTKRRHSAVAITQTNAAEV